LSPALEQFQAQLNGFVQQALGDEVLAGTAGVMLPTNVSADLYAAGLDLSAIGREALTSVQTDIPTRSIDAPLDAAAIPIKRRLLDWFMLRSNNKVREQLFGGTDRPSLRIPVEVKAKRITEEGRATMRQELDRFKGRFFHETLVRAHKHVVSEYSTGAVHTMEAALKTRDGELDKELGEIVSTLMEHRKVLAHLTELETQLQAAKEGVEQLSEMYAETEPTMLIQPAPPEMELKPKAPPVVLPTEEESVSQPAE